jgi:hypothetical protein
MPSPPTAQPEQTSRLIGAWSLLRWTLRYPDGRAEHAPFGFDAEGLLVYSADGWMSATLSRRVRDGRGGPRGADSGYIGYSGPWHTSGGDVVHEVRWASDPLLVNTRQVRSIHFVGEQLHLEAQELDPRGRSRTHVLSWRRA